MPNVRCTGCGFFFTVHGLSHHLRQTEHPPCKAIYDAQQAYLPGLDDISDDSDSDDSDHLLHAFAGDFFGSDYGPDDFGYEDADDVAPEGGYPQSDSESDEDLGIDDADNDADWEPPPRHFSTSPIPDGDDEKPDHANDQHGCLLTEAERQQLEAQIWATTVVIKFDQNAGRPILGAELSHYAEFWDVCENNAPGNMWAPFRSKLEWEFASWAKLRGPTLMAVTDLLSMEGVADLLGLAFKNSQQLNHIINEQLPGRPAFKCREIVIDGHAYDVYFRDIIQCIKALYGDPEFQPYLVFAPEKQYVDDTYEERMFHDMHTRTWWWATQEQVEADKPGATIIPIIISSDKTQLTLFRNKAAYPVYLTIGNIPKDIRRKPSCGAQILLAYLPTTRLEHIKNKAGRRRALANLFHACMCRVLLPLHDAGVSGIPMASGDGVVWRCHPIYACFLGDYPEQMLVICTKNRECYRCKCPQDEMGEDEDYLARDLDAVLNALDTVDGPSLAYMAACLTAGIKPIFHPFWEDLPYLNIFESVTSDILHQLYQGVVKHLITWLREAFGDEEIDACCRRMPCNHNLRHFSNGITSMSRVTGTEHRDVCRVLLGLVVDLRLPDNDHVPRLIRCVWSLLDFVYIAQYPSHTSTTLGYMDEALDTFHANKDIFEILQIRDHFNIPKIHTLHHYRSSIEMFGTTDNYDTSYTEHLHIDLAKDAYRATNQKDEYSQMTRWLDRKEKVQRHSRFIAWRLSGHPEVSMAHRIEVPLG